MARYGELTVAPSGTSAIVSYPDEEQMYFIVEGRGTVSYGAEKAAVKKDDFLYLPVGVRHSVANASDAPLRVMVMGYKVPAGTKVEPTAKLILANAGDVALQVRQSWSDYAVQATDGTHLQHARQTRFRIRYGQPFHH